MLQRSGEALQLDQLVRKRIEHDLGASKSIAYYFPKFVAWSAGGLVVSVGVESTRGRSGSFTFHCYGFELALRPARI